MIGINVPNYEEQVYAAVLGKVIGVYMGRPFEGQSRRDIAARFGEIGRYVAAECGAPLVVADADPIDGSTTSGGGVPIRKETVFAAEVFPLSVVIVTTHVYSPSARFSIANEAVAPDWPDSASTAAASLSE